MKFLTSFMAVLSVMLAVGQGNAHEKSFLPDEVAQVDIAMFCPKYSDAEKLIISFQLGYFEQQLEIYSYGKECELLRLPLFIFIKTVRGFDDVKYGRHNRVYINEVRYIVEEDTIKEISGYIVSPWRVESY